MVSTIPPLCFDLVTPSLLLVELANQRQYVSFFNILWGYLTRTADSTLVLRLLDRAPCMIDRDDGTADLCTQIGHQEYQNITLPLGTWDI